MYSPKTSRVFLSLEETIQEINKLKAVTIPLSDLNNKINSNLETDINKIISIKNGLVVPLCRQCHSNENIIMELKAKMQKEYEKNYTRADFIKLIGKSYIKEETNEY